MFENNIKMLAFVVIWAISSVTGGLIAVFGEVGNLEAITILLASAVAEQFEYSPLHVAAADGNKEEEEKLLQTEDVNSIAKNNWTPLHLAAYHNHPDVMELLVKQDGIDVNARIAHKRTALHIAAENGFEKVVEKLLEAKGIEIDARDVDKRTPRHLAHYYQHFEVVQLLAKHGSDKNAVDKDGRKPLDLFYKTQRPGQNVIRVVPSDPNEPVDEKKESLSLHAAVVKGDKEEVEKLLKTEDVNGRDENDMTPIHLAASNNHPEVVEVLAKHPGINVNARTTGKKTALHIAAEKGYDGVAKKLLAAEEIDVDAKDEDGNTPIQVAVVRNHRLVSLALLNSHF